MLQEARERDPYDLHRWGLSLLHQLAPQEMVAEEERRHRRRHVHLSERFDGGYELAGYLDPIGGVALKTAINGLLGRRPKDDQRTPGAGPTRWWSWRPGSWTRARCRCGAASGRT